MAKFRFSNNASALTVATLSSTATSVPLEAGAGIKCPSLSGGDTFRATLVSASGQTEIVTCTQVLGDTVTIIRGQEGTAAATFASGSRFEVRMTAGVADSFVQRTGDVMQGPLDLAGFPLLRPNFTAGPVRFSVIHADIWRAASTPLDQVYSTAENAIYIPNNVNGNFDFRRPGYMGRIIPNTQMFDGVVFMWFGDVNNVPSHLRLCNGTQSTPDMRGLFVRGWTDSFGVGGVGGAEAYNSTAMNPPTHNHGGGAAGATLSRIHIGGDTLVDVGFLQGGNVIPGGGGSIGLSKTFGGGQPHGHGIVSDGTHIHATPVIPPYIAMAYVMFKY